MNSICRTQAIALTGLRGEKVTVEAAISNQLPGMAIIGLPDTVLAESKLRVKLAAAAVGLPLTTRFITVNLSPAALPKHGSGFDLAIALSALAASGHIADPSTKGCAYIGELALDGTVRRAPGLLTAVVAAQNLGFKRVMVSAEAAAEASLVSDLEVICVQNLAAAVRWHRAEAGQWHIAKRNNSCTNQNTTSKKDIPDMSEIIGQKEAINAFAIAATGRHNLSMIGPPGAGKSMLAKALPGILPELTPQAALETTCIAALGKENISELKKHAPFIAPHHTASAVAIVGGGGKGILQPGAITYANNGVLFLDEAPEFSPKVLDCLRQPLETGTIEIARAKLRAKLPADFQLILAANPCPCGYANATPQLTVCQCTPFAKRKYMQRLSGPLLDRIDIHLQLERVSTVYMPQTTELNSAAIKEKVIAARKRQSDRYDKTAWNYNSQAPGTWLRNGPYALPRAATAILDAALNGGAISLRGYDRILRVAWSIADYNGKKAPTRQEISQAMRLRGRELC